MSTDVKSPVDSGSVFNALLSSDIDVGHCVIVNDVEQPCGKLVSVVVSVAGDKVVTKYLNADQQLTSYNKKGVTNRRETVTPIGSFGVEVRVNEHNVYWCEPISESKATYADGERRPWQERGGIGKYTARPDVLRVATSG